MIHLTNSVLFNTSTLFLMVLSTVTGDGTEVLSWSVSKFMRGLQCHFVIVFSSKQTHENSLVSDVLTHNYFASLDTIVIDHSRFDFNEQTDPHRKVMSIKGCLKRYS